MDLILRLVVHLHIQLVLKGTEVYNTCHCLVETTFAIFDATLVKFYVVIFICFLFWDFLLASQARLRGASSHCSRVVLNLRLEKAAALGRKL